MSSTIQSPDKTFQ
jgi:hypothetical protein